MKVFPTDIPDVLLLEPKVHQDDRGFFLESYNQRTFDDAVGAKIQFVQDNESHSRRGVLRGLHYQLPPHPQGKLVRVTRGAAFDVAVDIRRGSPHFGRWVGVELSDENKRQLWIPEGFAHGFIALADDTRFAYKTTDVYAKDCERAIAWNDPAIGITWPDGIPPLLAPKDQAAPALAAAETFA